MEEMEEGKAIRENHDDMAEGGPFMRTPEAINNDDRWD